MQQREVRLLPAARADLEAIVDYLDEHNSVAAIRFVEAAQATFEVLEYAASAFPSYRSMHPRLFGVRWRPLTGAFRRYLVFYRVREDVVDVVRILHSARDLERVLLDEIE